MTGQVAGQVASCGGCLAWGQVRRDGRCTPCADFAVRWPPTRCGACRRTLPTKKGYCRLCWHQARLDRSARLGGAGGTYGLLLPDLRRVRHHQLFLAGAFVHRDVVGKPASRRHGAGSGAPGVIRKAAPPAAVRPRIRWLQPGLFDTPPRVYRVGQVDLRSSPAPDNPWLSWALHLAHTRAETRGWTSAALRTLNRSLVMVLAGHRDGELIRVSDVAPVLRRRYNSVGHLLEILAAMDVLLDDREPIFERWLHGKTTGLAPAISDHTRRWAKTLHDGGPRIRARSELTVRSRVDAALPALTDWSTRYDHLREISPHDVLTHLAATRAGQRRQRTATALRSLFSWAKTTGVVFTDPTRRIPVTRPAPVIPQPLTGDQLTTALQAASTLQARVAVVLAAVHAARHGEIIDLRLSDVDLDGRRLTIAGRTRPLDDLTHQVLNDWLEHRRRRWPNTANPHLLITHISAQRLTSVTHPWINRTLQGQPVTLEQLRIDRHLEEALANGADPALLAAVFGVTEATALRYTTAARALLAPGPAPDHDHDRRLHGEPTDSAPLWSDDRPPGSS